MLRKHIPTPGREAVPTWTLAQKREAMDAWALSMGRDAAELWLQAVSSHDARQSSN